MARTVAFNGLAAILGTRDLDAALARYAKLGFEVRPYNGDERYGFADRGAVSLHIAEWPGHDPRSSAGSVYLYVDDADALHSAWSRAGVEGRFVGPHDTPYGLREFAYVDPDGTLLRAGSPLEAPNAERT